MRKPTEFHGWRIVKAGLVTQLLQSMLMQQSFGAYAAVLKDEFGWSSTVTSAAYSMNRLESGMLGPPHGWALDRFGPKRVVQVGAVVMAGGLMLFSQLHSQTQFFAFYFFVAVGASLAGFMSVTTATVRWFERRRAQALSISQAGFPLGGLGVPVVVWCFGTFGWRATSFGSGVLVLLVLLPMSRWFVDRPSDLGQHVDGMDPEQAAAFEARRPRHREVGTVTFTAQQALRTRSFWFISIGHSLALLIVSALSANLVNYLKFERGYSLQTASFVAASLPLMQLAGQLMGGWLGDRYSKRMLAVLAMVGHLVGVGLLAQANAPWMIWAFVPLHGVAWGVRGPLMQAMRADYFGSGSFGQIMGWSSLIIMVGQMGGALISGILDDVTGSFRLGFLVVAALSAPAIFFFWFAKPPRRRWTPRSPPRSADPAGGLEPPQSGWTGPIPHSGPNPHRVSTQTSPSSPMTSPAVAPAR